MNINQKGITLIALVITIIVLLILAGVSIAMLTGQNGILTQASSAKVAQIEGQVKEEVNLAVQAAKMYAEEQAVSTSTGYSADSHLEVTGTAPNTTDNDIIEEMTKTDLTAAKGYNVVGNNTEKSITVTYTTPDYEAARNTDGASIVFTIKVDGNNFEITEITGSQTINLSSGD